MKTSYVQKAALTTGPVGQTLIRMTLPLFVGLFAIIAFNLVDTYFVSKLGTIELAAMGFTFPVVMVLTGISLGLGVGTSASISKAIGEGNVHKVRRLATHSLILGFIVVTIFSVIGLFTIDPLFTALGADNLTLPLIKRYMTIWYLGMIFVVIPMVGNSAIRATGDTRIPGLIMLMGASINLVLDPLLIFGLAGFPRLDLAGAAIATVIARMLTCIAAIAILHFRERMLIWGRTGLEGILHSWRSITWIGVRASMSHTMAPISVAFIIRLAANHGQSTVAALSAGFRVTAFSLIPIFALATSIVPFVGQCWGAGMKERTRKGWFQASGFVLVWGSITALLLFVMAPRIAHLFSNDHDVVTKIALYLRIIPLGYGLQGVLVVTNAMLNGIHRPIHATLLIALRLFVFFVPLAYLGSYLFNVTGMFGGMALGTGISGIIAFSYSRKIFNTTKAIGS